MKNKVPKSVRNKPFAREVADEMGFGFCLKQCRLPEGYIKGALEAVSEDRMMAAFSIGLSKVRAIFYVIINPLSFKDRYSGVEQ